MDQTRKIQQAYNIMDNTSEIKQTAVYKAIFV